MGTKDAAACEALYYRFQTYLSLPRNLQHQRVFLALIRDMHNQVANVRGLSSQTRIVVPSHVCSSAASKITCACWRSCVMRCCILSLSLGLMCATCQMFVVH